MNALTLRPLDVAPGEGHSGEVFAVAYSADGAFALSGGWDGQLRLWETTTGGPVTSLEVGHKALSSCAFAPDDQVLLAGSMEGLFSAWDAASHQPKFNFLAHTRPISGIRFSPDGKLLATTSWDRQISLRKVGREREGRTLAGHLDIVAGCRFTPDGKHLLSWSYDGTLILWEVESGRQVWAPPGHNDRVLSAAIAPDGHWAASVSRDGILKVWDINFRGEVGGLPLTGVPVACSFLLDGESLLTVNTEGVVVLLAVPTFEVKAELQTGIKTLCAELSPSGAQLALGGADGRVHFLAVAGLEEAPLVVTAAQALRPSTSVLDRVFGKTRMIQVFQFTCPSCRCEVDSPSIPAGPFRCPRCKRTLRVHGQVRQLANANG